MITLVKTLPIRGPQGLIRTVLLVSPAACYGKQEVKKAGTKVLIAAWWSTLQLQIRGNHEPHAFKTLAGGLAGGRISGVGIEGMAVVFDLVAVCSRISAQLAGKRTWTRGDS